MKILFKTSMALMLACVLSACGLLSVLDTKKFMLEPFSDVQSLRLYTYKSEEIHLSKEQKDAIVIEMSERLKSPWNTYFGKASNQCMVLEVKDNGYSRHFNIFEMGVEVMTGGHGGALSMAHLAPDSILRKLHQESKCD